MNGVPWIFYGLSSDNMLKARSLKGSVLRKLSIKDCTDWPETVDWFDSVVHQDVEHVEGLSFMAASSLMQTIYLHFEPLREIKVQAFPMGDTRLSLSSRGRTLLCLC